MLQVCARRCSTWGTKGAAQGDRWLVSLTCIFDTHFLLGTRCTPQDSILLRQTCEFVCRIFLLHLTLHGYIDTLNVLLFSDLVWADKSAFLSILGCVCLSHSVWSMLKWCLFATSNVRESRSELILVLASSTLKLVLQLLISTTAVVYTIVSTVVDRSWLRVELRSYTSTLLPHLNINDITRRGVFFGKSSAKGSLTKLALNLVLKIKP